MAIQFPNSPGIGSVFTDTDAGFSYEWTGVVWKSFTPAAANNIKELDDISSGFDNSTTTFNLTIGGEAYQPRNAAMLQISLGGVIQEPSTDYTVSTSTITFTTAPSSGLDFFGVVRGTAVAIDFANDGNVQTKQEFTATLGQTSFTVTGGYTTGYIDVFRNGVRLGSDDFTDTSGTAIVLTVPAQADDLIEVVKYNVASLVVSQGEFTNLNISGVTTVGVLTGATSIQSGVFYGDGSALTGIDATSLKDSGGNVKVQTNEDGVVITGFATATTFVGNLTGDATGLSGSPTIAVTNVTGVAATFTGNVTIGGTLTYQDVTNIDSVGIITAQQGIQVLANGLDITGVSTFKGNITTNASNIVLGVSGGATDDRIVLGSSPGYLQIYNSSGATSIIDGGSAQIINKTPDFQVQNAGGDLMLKAANASSVDLYFNASKKFETTTSGVTVTGSVTADGYDGNLELDVFLFG